MCTRFLWVLLHICTLTICTLNQKKMFVENIVFTWEVIKILSFLVVTKKKTFFVSKNSKFWLRYHHWKVLTYLCVKDHVSKLWRFFKKWTNVWVNCTPVPLCLWQKINYQSRFARLDNVYLYSAYSLGALSALHHYYPDRPVHSRAISTSWEAYECTLAHRANTLSTQQDLSLSMTGYPFKIHLDGVRK